MSICTPPQTSELLAFHCACGEPYQSATKNSGRKFECGKCGRVVTVPPSVAEYEPEPVASNDEEANLLDALAHDQATAEPIEPEPLVTLPRTPWVSPNRTAPKPLRITYPACQSLRIYFSIFGVLWLMVAGFGAFGMVVLLIGGGKDGQGNWPAAGVSAAVAFSALFTGLLWLALSELLGGVVNYLTRNDCGPA